MFSMSGWANSAIQVGTSMGFKSHSLMASMSTVALPEGADRVMVLSVPLYVLSETEANRTSFHRKARRPPETKV